jgi:hypothetical protein
MKQTNLIFSLVTPFVFEENAKETLLTFPDYSTTLSFSNSLKREPISIKAGIKNSSIEINIPKKSKARIIGKPKKSKIKIIIDGNENPGSSMEPLPILVDLPENGSIVYVLFSTDGNKPILEFNITTTK